MIEAGEELRKRARASTLSFFAVNSRTSKKSNHRRQLTLFFLRCSQKPLQNLSKTPSAPLHPPRWPSWRQLQLSCSSAGSPPPPRRPLLTLPPTTGTSPRRSRRPKTATPFSRSARRLTGIAAAALSAPKDTVTGNCTMGEGKRERERERLGEKRERKGQGRRAARR